MKNTILFFFLLLAAAVSAQSNSFVTDRLRAAEYFRIGTNTSQKVTGFDKVITAPGTHDSLPTSRAVVDFLEANFTPIGYYTAGTGISISDDVITNSAPDQVVGLTGAGITVITGTYPNFTITSNEVDGSTTNELQNLSLSGQSLSISSGTGVTLPVVGVSAGTGIGVSGSSGTYTITNTGDLSNTNEIQTLSIVGSSLSLSNGGGTVALPATGITALNSQTGGTQTFAVGTTGTDFAVSSSSNTHTFNLPTASASNRGALSSADWSTFNSKVGGSGTSGYLPKFSAAATIANSIVYDNGTNIGIGTTSPTALPGFAGKSLHIYDASSNLPSLYIQNSANGFGVGLDNTRSYFVASRSINYYWNDVSGAGGSMRFFNKTSGSAVVAAEFDASNNYKLYGRLNISTYTPTSSSDALGASGDITWDANYIYIKTASGWKRAALSTF